MALTDAIRNFPRQFEFTPTVVNAAALKPATKFAVCAMGGSNHATDVLKAWRPAIDIIVHRDYGLPAANDLAERLIIACSYSGNTEESLDAFREARSRGLNLAAIATGHQLLDLAKEQGIPYIEIPSTGIQPRSATGFMFMALLKLMGDEADLQEAAKIGAALQSSELEASGRDFAKKLNGRVPIVYASSRNFAIANNWKVKFTENTKIPAFMNVLPELNHHEMNGFDVTDKTRPLAAPFHFVFLKDEEDHPRVVKRMAVLERLYRDRGLPVEVVPVAGRSRLEKLLSSLMLADWTSYYLAEAYGIDPEPVPMVEEFKHLLKAP